MIARRITDHPIQGDYGLVNIPQARPFTTLAGMNFNHAIICVGFDEIAEAWFSGVRTVPMNHYESVVWYRVDAPIRHRYRAAWWARQLIGQKYDYASWFGLLFGAGIKLTTWQETVLKYSIDSDAHNCSGFIAQCYKRAGIKLVPGKATNLVLPDDLDFEKVL
jgi:uncharacterized protein YycO